MRDDRPRIRPGTDADSADVIALIDRCYAEYPGNVLDVDGEEPCLRAPASSFDAFLVVEVGGSVRGCAAALLRPDHLEVKKVYLDAGLRGRGLAPDLIARLETMARARGLYQVQLWSDTRFLRAHAFYRKLGYRCTGEQRDLHDLSNTTEVRFVKQLAAGDDAPVTAD